MSAFDFLQWAFRSSESTGVVILVMCTFFWGLAEVVKAFRGDQS